MERGPSKNANYMQRRLSLVNIIVTILYILVIENAVVALFGIGPVYEITLF